MSGNKKKSQYVELTRFIGAIIILCHHSYLLVDRTQFFGGWAFVEYFFMLTGYFTAFHFSDAERYKNDCEKQAVGYMKDKVLRIVPYAAVGVILGALYTFMQPHSVDEKWVGIFSLPFNFFMLRGSTFSNETYGFNAPIWYVTVIILFLPLIIMLMVKAKNIYKNYLCWFLPIILYGINVEFTGKACAWNVSIYEYFRGIAGMMAGTFIYYLSESPRIQAINSNKSKKILCRFISCLMFIAYLWITIRFRGGGIDISGAVTLVTWFVACSVLFVKENIVNSSIIYNICIHLGKLSMPIFCIHHPIEQLVQQYIPQVSYNKKLILCIILSIIISEIVIAVIQVIKKVIKKHRVIA